VKGLLFVACAALSLVASVASAGSQLPSGEPGATPSAAPRVGGKADSQQDAESAFARAKADCRRVEKSARRDCIVRAEKDYDRTQRVVKPRKPAKEELPAR